MAEKQTPEQKGTLFLLKGGPYDEHVMRLYPQKYANAPESAADGWDELPAEGGKYVRPHNAQIPEKNVKPNKGRTNIPHMDWEPRSGGNAWE